ncbi:MULTISPECIES: carbohydrate ABC transporter permease [Kitasatospora]|uniref:carbohydrate ABC transporter permease n=1 Tax=Kitasatospora TaxID=2063 RepID=UPI0004C2D7EA|nr:sugar ABC transporter permease [Kitasatospora sp. NRRL B-11411]
MPATTVTARADHGDSSPVRPAGGAPAGARRRPGLLARIPVPLWLLLPAALVLIPLFGYPLYQLGLLSVLKFGQPQASGGVPTEFVGLSNYTDVLGDAQFWTVLGQTLAFAAFCVLTTLAVGATCAVLLTRVGRWPRLMLMFGALGAWAAPAMTGSTVWMFLLDTNSGLVNEVLGTQGHNWMYDKWSAFAMVAVVVVWHSFPFVMITLYAGIQAIPDSVVEAARLDGAGTVTVFRKIMLPMLRPLLVIVVIQSIIWDFKVFTQIYVMTGGGGIAGQNLVLNVYAYQKAFVAENYSLGAAIGVLMTLILLGVTAVYIRSLRRSGEEL